MSCSSITQRPNESLWFNQNIHLCLTGKVLPGRLQSSKFHPRLGIGFGLGLGQRQSSGWEFSAYHIFVFISLSSFFNVNIRNIKWCSMQLVYGYGASANLSWGPKMIKRKEKLKMINTTTKIFFQIWYFWGCNYSKRLATGNPAALPRGSAFSSSRFILSEIVVTLSVFKLKIVELQTLFGFCIEKRSF